LAVKKVAHKSIVTTLFLHEEDLSTGAKYNKPHQKKQTFVLAFWQKWLVIYFLPESKQGSQVP